MKPIGTNHLIQVVLGLAMVWLAFGTDPQTFTLPVRAEPVVGAHPAYHSGGLPAAPSSLDFEEGPGYVLLSWSPPDPGQEEVIGYVVYRGDSPGQLVEIARPGNVLFYNDTNVENGRWYYYSVSALNAEGEGPLSPTLGAFPHTSLTVQVEADVTTGEVPFEVHFDSTVSGGVPEYSYEWDFGDGSSSTEVDPTHTYSLPGAYTVMLAVTDGRSASESSELQLLAMGNLTVVVDADPRIEGIEIDGTVYASDDLPLVFTWELLSLHQISTPEMVEDGDTRYLFLEWSDGLDDPVRSVLVEESIELGIEYQIQHYLELSSEYGNPEGEGWYDEDVMADFSVDSFLEYDNGTRRVVTGYRGDAKSSGSSGTIRMSEPRRIDFEWKIQYLLTMSSDFEEPFGSGWYDGSTVAQFGVQSPVPVGEGRRFAVTGFTGDATGLGASGSVLMDDPKEIIFLWRAQFELRVSTTYGTASGSGWYDSGIAASSRTTSPIPAGPGKRHTVLGYSLDGGPPIEGETASIVMDAPHEIDWKWKVQWQVTVDPTQGRVTVDTQTIDRPAAFWFDEESQHVIHALPFIETARDARRIFVEWDDGSASLTRSMTVSQSKVFRAAWKDQIRLTFSLPQKEMILDRHQPPRSWIVIYSGGTVNVPATVWADLGSTWNYSQSIHTGEGERWSVARGDTGTVRIMDAGTTMIPTAAHQFRLDLEGVAAFGEGWYDEGVRVTAGHTRVWQIVANTTRMILDGYRLDQGLEIPVTRSAEGNFTVSVVMDSPRRIEFNGERQYFLKITSLFRAVSGEGWYDSGSDVRVEAQAVVDISRGTRAVFSRWIGLPEDADQSTQRLSLKMMTPMRLEAQWTVQYRVDVQAKPQRGGGIFPPSGWHDANSTLTISADPAKDFEWLGWEGSGSGSYTGSSQTMTIIIDGPMVQTARFRGYVTIEFNVEGLPEEEIAYVTADGDPKAIQVDEAVSLEWIVGDLHRFAFQELVYGDEGTRFQLEIVNATSPYEVDDDAVIVAVYQPQYLVSIRSDGPISLEPEPEEVLEDAGLYGGWYYIGTTVQASGLLAQDEGSRLISKSYGKARQAVDGAVSFVVEGPMGLEVTWSLQHLLTVESEVGGLTKAEWHDHDDAVTLEALQEVTERKVRYLLIGYSLDGAESIPHPSTIVKMDSPHRISWLWKTQYWLELSGPTDEYTGMVVGNPQGEGWYDRGVRAEFSVSETWPAGPESRYRLVGYSGSATGSEPSGEVMMSGPGEVILQWAKEDSLSIAYRPQGIKERQTIWLAEGSEFMLEELETISALDGGEFVLDRILLDGVDIPVGALSIMMEKPHELILTYRFSTEITLEFGGYPVRAALLADSRVEVRQSPEIGRISLIMSGSERQGGQVIFSPPQEFIAGVSAPPLVLLDGRPAEVLSELEQGSVSWKIRYGSDTSVIDIYYTPASARVLGRSMLLGSPLAGAQVFLSSSDVMIDAADRTDEGGEYRTLLPPTRITIILSYEGRLSSLNVSPSGGETYEIRVWTVADLGLIGTIASGAAAALIAIRVRRRMRRSTEH